MNIRNSSPNLKTIEQDHGTEEALRIQKERVFLVVAVLTLLLAFFLRVYDITNYPPGIHPDEAQQFLRHWRYSAGYGHPMFYEGAPEPFDSMMRGTWGHFAGMKQFTMRYWSILLNVLACGAVIGASKVFFRKHPQRFVIAIFAGLILTTIPSTVIIGRAIYRANELIFWTPMALWALGRVWQRRKLRDALFLGVTTAAGTMMYLAGPFLAMSITASLIVLPLLDRRLWMGWRNLVAYGVTVGVMMLPWLYLFVTIPGWLTSRLQDFSPRELGTEYRFDLMAFADQFRREIGMFIQPNRYFAPNYNTLTSGFLNPVLVIFLLMGVLGLVWAILRKRDVKLSAIVMVLGAMMLPAALTTAPEEAIRSVGVFAPLAMLTAFGVGVAYEAIHRRGALPAKVGLIALFVGSPMYTGWHIANHYQTIGFGEKDAMYFATLREQVTAIFDTETPVYIPLEYLNFRTAASFFRPEVSVRPYDGGDLPAGDVLVLFDSWYGTPLVNKAQSYGVYLPETKEIVILPPLQAGNRQAIEQMIIEEGEQIRNDRGGWLFYRMALVENDPLLKKGLLPATSTRETPLVVVDDTLELWDVVLPETIKVGEWNSITLYWRINKPTATDYYANLQLWRQMADLTSHGRSFEQFNHIYGDLAPTPTWIVGAFYTEEKFVYVFPDTAAGGYYWALNVYDQPNSFDNPIPSPAVMYAPARPLLDLAVIGQSWIGEPPYVEASSGAINVDVVFEDSVQLTAIDVVEQSDDFLTLNLYWEVIAPPVDNAILFIHVTDAEGTLIAQQDAEPLSDFRLDTWQAGQRIMTPRRIPLPETSPAPASIAMGMYRFGLNNELLPVSMARGGEAVFQVVVELG